VENVLSIGLNRIQLILSLWVEIHPVPQPHADMVVGLWIDCTGTLPEQILSTTSASTGDLHPKRENQVDSAKAYR